MDNDLSYPNYVQERSILSIDLKKITVLINVELNINQFIEHTIFLLMYCVTVIFKGYTMMMALSPLALL